MNTLCHKCFFFGNVSTSIQSAADCFVLSCHNIGHLAGGYTQGVLYISCSIMLCRHLILLWKFYY